MVAVQTEVTGSYRALAESFRRSLLAANRSPQTITAYRIGVELFGAFLVAKGMPTAVGSITREYVETFLAETLATRKPATAFARHAALRAFFKWLVEEGEVKASPMTNIRPPHVPEAPPSVLSDAELSRLLRACDGKDLESRRDMAILRLLLDTGMRRSELAGLKVEDIDFDHNIALVVGKGRRPRA
jgi:site-specific recombinase XerD